MADDFEDRLDRHWDDVVRGSARPSRDLDPEIADTIRWFHALGGGVTGVHAHPHGAAPNGTAPIAGPHGANWRSIPWRRVRSRRWPRQADLAAAAVLLLLLGSIALAVTLRSSSHTGQQDEGRLYLLDANGEHLLPVDPQSLVDLPRAAAATPVPFDFDAAERDPVRWLASADGSTLVRIESETMDGTDYEHPEEISIVVLDGPNGPERTRFHFPAGAIAQLSADGSRLLLGRRLVDMIVGDPSPPAMLDWSVYDTADGRLIATVPSAGRSPLPPQWFAWVDRSGQRFYELAAIDGESRIGPWAMQLVAFDLTTGGEVGRLNLPGVRAGGRISGVLTIETFLQPGGALSPDGRHLAILHDDGVTVTLIDVTRLTVERTVHLAPEFGTPDVSVTGDAGEVGLVRYWFAAYAADGQGLYVSGINVKTDADGRTVTNFFGLRLIDLVSGAIVAQGPSDLCLWFWPTADGRSIYTLGFAADYAVENDPMLADDPPPLLRRLDATSLTPLAERELLPESVTVLLWPRTPASTSG